jgi:tripartite-type tricarboxylate transporter receptor subunit TctC
MPRLSSAQRRAILRGLAALAVTVAAPALGQSGSQPVKLIVPTSPGSSADIGARSVGEQLRKVLGRPVLTENRVGAGGSIAAAALATSQPNGETIGVFGSSYLLFPQEFPKLKFDPLQDVAPVALISKGANVLLVSSASPYRTLTDLIERARAEPGKITYASAGIGSSTFHSAERLRMAAGLDLVHVPLKGAPESAQEVIAGRVDFAFVPVPVAGGIMQGDRARALAVSASKRSALLPQTPTTVEAGVPGSSYDTWLVALVPAKTPAATQLELNKAFRAALDGSEIRQRFEALGVEPASMSLEELLAFIRQEYADAMAHAKAKKTR